MLGVTVSGGTMNALGLAAANPIRCQRAAVARPYRGSLRSRGLDVDNLEQRFLAKVEKTADCWIWRAYRHEKGYGRIGVGGHVKFAHRIAYELFVGPIPAGLQIDHLCRNRGCVNLAHLEPVTARENCLRGTVFHPDACHRGHPRSAENTYNDPSGIRHCRVCSGSHARPRSRVHPDLTPGQEAVLDLRVDGVRERDVALRLGVSRDTVHSHLWAAKSRLGAPTVGAAIEIYRLLRAKAEA